MAAPAHRGLSAKTCAEGLFTCPVNASPVDYAKIRHDPRYYQIWYSHNAHLSRIYAEKYVRITRMYVTAHRHRRRLRGRRVVRTTKQSPERRISV
ncbi:hypothetical protein K1T71_004194 [Dendrolimus kikuchii]|uniref:Uncharacterized protein n=1 Tax=Dendrolimus kikuchii TaxID=765133 RepID=A0ACC1DAB4_9NEOP|nr:hypothetical protein K1T71_004194 [Dendrolimus kikuchii]